MAGHGNHLRSARHVRRRLTTVFHDRSFQDFHFMNADGFGEAPSMRKLLINRRTLLTGAAVGAALGWPGGPAQAVTRLDGTQGNIQPMPIALPDFIGGTPADSEVAHNVTQVLTGNLKRSGLVAPTEPCAPIAE